MFADAANSKCLSCCCPNCSSSAANANAAQLYNKRWPPINHNNQTRKKQLLHQIFRSLLKYPKFGNQNFLEFPNQFLEVPKIFGVYVVVCMIIRLFQLLL
ncbi:hypothetical protein OXYTRIMIC_807 [Oxytricha trifallax]|uniref:Uncharacterized protein n=1 Tax=Oxytricha trifallax TaxID=1172189 RepID=A0A073HZB8_9SPIT|nr:hypothetical protein OXYTRIMIC_807 [Oxytricha trifallax]